MKGIFVEIQRQKAGRKWEGRGKWDKREIGAGGERLRENLPTTVLLPDSCNYKGWD